MTLRETASMADADRAWSFRGSDVSIVEAAIKYSVLRLHRDDADTPKSLGAAFSTDWPVTPNTTSSDGQIIWMAPGEWGVLLPAAEIAGAVAQACGDRLHHLTDVSAGRRLWRIEGAGARTVIAKGCSLDTHPTVMSANACARTVFAQVPILLIARDAGAAFDLVADASYAGHLRAWFAQAAQEFAR
jgi:sarcosine oxidase, subunit gamma